MESRMIIEVLITIIYKYGAQSHIKIPEKGPTL